MSNGDSWFESLLESWWGQIIAGLIFFAFAWFFHAAFTNLETQGGQIRLPWYLWIFYWCGGKWAAVAFFVIPGLLFVIIGVKSCVDVWRGTDRDSR
jgi:hypothetical protein